MRKGEMSSLFASTLSSGCLLIESAPSVGAFRNPCLWLFACTCCEALVIMSLAGWLGVLGSHISSRGKGRGVQAPFVNVLVAWCATI